MASGIHSGTSTSPSDFGVGHEPTEPARTETAEERKGIQEKLLSAALSSIKANDSIMEMYAAGIEKHSEYANDATNLLTRLDDIKEDDGLELSGDDAAQDADIKKIINAATKIAPEVGVDVPKCLKDCVSAYEASGEVQKLKLNKDELGRLKTLCKSISDRVGKLETQDQMRLNQAQQDHSNTIKWIVNVLNSYQSLIDKIIQMGERR